MKSLNTCFLILITLLFPFSVTAQDYNYAEVLQKSMFFYECQQSGELESTNRVTWRGNSALEDGEDEGVDLTGGWYDAGDHVKFNFPMAYTATVLAWGAIDFEEGYEESEQMVYLKRNLRWVNDYFIKCHTTPNTLYGQVGNGSTDHSWWGSAEVMQMDRPAYEIDSLNPGSDLAAETAAAMAAASMVFADDDPDYSATLLKHAKQLYDFADTYRGVYTSSITDAASYYNSYSGYNDELVWGAIWLYRATGDEDYLDKAEEYYDNLSTDSSGNKAYDWGLSWDDKSCGCYALLAKLTGEDEYKEDIERHLDYWTDGYNGNQITYTDGGLAYLDSWGSLRYAANTSFLAAYYADAATTSAKTTTYNNFAATQLAYILGDNPLNISYVCGYGDTYPVNPHHRTAHGCWSNNVSGEPTETRHTLYGALVGGPGSDDSYSDVRSDYQKNEVACDYNACFSGLLAHFVEEDGGTPLTDFPVEETPSDEYLVKAKINTEGDVYTEWSVYVFNHTAWPARSGGEYKFRIFVDITEGIDAGYTVDDYIVSTNNSSTVDFTDLQAWDADNNIYYTEVTFNSSVDIWPGGDSESKEEAQIRIRLPYDADSEAWDSDNDPSYDGLTSTLTENENIPLYVDGDLVYGSTPTDPITVESLTLSVDSYTMDIGDSLTLIATIAPDDATDQSVEWSSDNDSVATVDEDGTVIAKASGTALIKALSSTASVYDSCEITVNEAPYVDVTGLSLSSDSLDLDINEQATLTAIVYPEDATDGTVTWSSSNTDIATVNEEGGVTGVAAGTAVITAVSSANEDVTAKCEVTVSEVEVVYYTLSVSTSGSGSVTVSPEGTSFEEGTEVILTAVADSGYDFDTWSGDVTGTDESISVTMSSDVAITANFVEEDNDDVSICEDPETVSLPFSFDEASEGCYVTSDEISYINSWNMETVTINGEDYTNVWSSSMPDKVNGKYYIYLKGNYSWSHFEAALSETTDSSSDDSDSTETTEGDDSENTNDTEETGDTEETTSTICEDPETVSLPFTFDEASEGCYVTSDDISYINSWNMETVTINGDDYTNAWSSSMPDKVDGNYYIYLKGNYSWSHFEAISSSTDSKVSIGLEAETQAEGSIAVYPNPFSDGFYIQIPDVEDVVCIKIYNEVGSLMKILKGKYIESKISEGSSFDSGIYIVVVQTKDDNKTFKIVKK